MIAFLVAAMVVTLLQFLRLRDRRLLPLLGLFSFLALGHFRGEWDTWGRAFFFAGAAMGLVEVLMLSARHSSRIR
jgi:hypothetical protein